MSNYTKTTNFASKDNLSPGNPLKIVKGTEIDTEFNNIQTAVGTKTDNASAAITGGTITGITDLAVADGGTGASTATAALNNLLPTQTGNANKYLQTDGTNATWDAVSLSTSDITGTLPVANGGTGVTSSTGTGAVVLSNSPTLVTPALGTPASGTATNLTGLPISTGVSGLGSGVATFLGTPSSANLASAVSDETGSGALVFANSPTLVTPALGTPSSGTLTNATGLPISTGVSGLGTGVATFLATPSSANLISAVTDETGTGSLVFATSPTLVTPALGTPSALVGTNITGTASGLTAGNVTTNANLTGAVTSVGNATSLGSFSSSNLAGALTDETGTGSAVFATSPTLVTPILGTPTSATLTNATGLPISTGVSGLGTGVATALAVNVGSSGAPLVNGGVLGTPSSGTATNLTGLPLSTGVTGTLPVANGGTGQTSYTDGQLLIGNSTGNTLTKATLTAGTNVTITNSAGGITIAATGGGGSGDVVGPSSATDNAIARFDTTTGKLLQNSVVTIGDTGVITGVTDFTATGSATATRFIPSGSTVATNGMYLPAANSLGLSTNSTEAIRISSAGSVGVNTTSMTGKFNITGSSGGISAYLTDAVNSSLAVRNALGGVILGTDPSGAIHLATNGNSTAERRLSIISSGNVGIATTAPGSALDVKGTLRLSGATSGYVGFAPAAAAGSTTYTLPSADGSSGQLLSTNGSGTLSWATAGGGSSQWTTSGSNIYYNTGSVLVGTTLTALTSGTALFAAVNSNALTKAFIGSSSAFSAGNAGGQLSLGKIDGSELKEFGMIEGSPQDPTSGADGILVFKTRVTNSTGERGRFNGQGFFQASNFNSYPDGSNLANHYFTSNKASNNTLQVRADSSSFAGASVLFLRGNRNTTDNTFRLIEANNGNDSGVFNVRDSGNCVNTNNSYGGTSDVKLKQDIVDASSQWDDIKNVRVRKYRFKNNPTGALNIGVIAQEIETVSAGLVESEQDYEDVQVPVLDSEGNPLLDENGNAQTQTQRNMLETTTKSVKYSVLYMKAVKALQEAMTRIEQLEARLDAANL